MVEGRYVMTTQDMGDLKKIWRQVFIEEYGWPPEMLDLDEEKLLLHAVVYEGEKKQPVAAGTIEYGEDAFLISNVAVVAEKRNRLYGDFVLRMLVNKAVVSGGMPVRAEVTREAEKLFETVGFTACGVRYEKNGITLCPYELPLSNVKSCCSCTT